jgi:hypothetical protein
MLYLIADPLLESFQRQSTYLANLPLGTRSYMPPPRSTLVPRRHQSKRPNQVQDHEHTPRIFLWPATER